MNRVKIIFCLFLFTMSFVYSKELFNNTNILNLIQKKDDYVLTRTLTKTNFKDPRTLLNLDNIKSKNQQKTQKTDAKQVSKTENKKQKNPLIYFYNTHQTEEYASSIHGITPTVMTVSTIMQEELKELGIPSIIEEKSVTKEVKKRGYDYSGTYAISFEYLKQAEKENPSLKYFFDMHRDSITGEASKTTIKNKNYAKLMFLVGTKNKNYQTNVKNIKIMEEYLKKHYPGILRETYYQSHSGYNQHYSDKMFLVELGGPDNTLEEIYNTSKALAEAIKYYVEAKNEK